MIKYWEFGMLPMLGLVQLIYESRLAIFFIDSSDVGRSHALILLKFVA